MRTYVAPIAAAALIAAAGVANAQECKGGYRMLPNQVPVPCDDSQVYAAPDRPIYEPVPEAPIITGSIGYRDRHYDDGYYVDRGPYYAGRYPYYVDRHYVDRPYRYHGYYRPYADAYPVGVRGCWPGEFWLTGVC